VEKIGFGDDSMTPELTKRIQEAHLIATDILGLVPGDVRFVMVPPTTLYSVMAGALPGHWQHWTMGRDFWISMSEHDHGHARIYELVLNVRPHLALLHDRNTEILNVLVAAHVFGHTHLDNSNIYFADANTQLLETVRTWAARIEAYEEEHGDLIVEAFIDKVMSLEPFADANYKGKVFREKEEEEPPIPDLFTLPPKPDRPEKLFQPTGDLYGFLAQYAPDLEDWQRDILYIYRQRELAFLPLQACKVLHEGFASIVHSKIMQEMTVGDDEWLEYSKYNSGVMSPSPGRMNPYWLGHAILESIVKEKGWEAMVAIASLENDASLVRNHLTEKLCDELELFTFSFRREDKAWVVDEEDDFRDWERIRDTIALKFSNYHSPVIEITEFDHDNKRGLYLTHRFDGRRLNMLHADRALAAVADIWGQQVILRTTLSKGDVEGTVTSPNERHAGQPDVDWEFVESEPQK